MIDIYIDIWPTQEPDRSTPVLFIDMITIETEFLIIPFMRDILVWPRIILKIKFIFKNATY